MIEMLNIFQSAWKEQQKAIYFQMLWFTEFRKLMILKYYYTNVQCITYGDLVFVKSWS